MAIALVHSLAAAPPIVNDMSLRGCQIGGTTVLTIQGERLLPNPRLLIPGVTCTQQLRSAATDSQIEMELTVDAATAPGVYPVWLASDHGVSNPLPLSLDRLPPAAFGQQIAALPVALHGRVDGGSVLHTSFSGQKGQRIVVEIEARRLGANWQPVVRLLDAQGAQITWGQRENRLDGDARCEAILAADGQYSIQIHDLLYRAAAPGFFRLKVGDFRYADLAFPLGVQRGTERAVQLLAGNMTGQNVMLAVPTSHLAHTAAVIPPDPRFAGHVARVAVSQHAELVEEYGPPGVQPLTSVPVAVSGALRQKAEVDRYALPVAPGARLRIELHAERFGSPLDGVLIVRRENGTEVARSDDQPMTPDPGLDFTVPADVEKLELAVEDLLKRGGESYLYRLEVRDLAQPSFSLNLETDRVNIPGSGAQVVRVTALRAGYAGPLALQFEGLPSGVEVSGQQIPPGGDVALVVLRASESRPLSGVLRLIGSGQVGDQSLAEVAVTPDTFRSQSRPWFREHLAVAAGQPAPVTLDWQAVGNEVLTRGQQLAVPLKLARAEGATGKVRIRLLTTQPMPRKKIKENNEEKEVDDVERALRLESEPVLAEDAKEATVAVLVPADLPERAWGLVFVAELLSADEKSVVASSTSSCRLIPTSASPPG